VKHPSLPKLRDSLEGRGTGSGFSPPWEGLGEEFPLYYDFAQYRLERGFDVVFKLIIFPRGKCRRQRVFFVVWW